VGPSIEFLLSGHSVVTPDRSSRKIIKTYGSSSFGDALRSQRAGTSLRHLT